MMKLFQKTKKLVTHNGSFHADDIFSSAALSILLEKKNEKFEIIRTRDKEIIKSADFVYDVGDIYDKNTNRFDHHQKGGAGQRANGILYSSFGLVWEKFGEEICGDRKASEMIDRKLVQSVDAYDNGMSLVEKKHIASPYLLDHMFLSMHLTWREDEKKIDELFQKSLNIAKEILKREIKQSLDILKAEEIILEIYQKSIDKRLIILDKKYPYEEILNKFKEPMYVVFERRDANKFWEVEAIRDDFKSFVNRKDFPTSWAGLRDEDLQKISGVDDALFCHRGLFMAVAKSKAGAIKLAQIAVESN